MGMMEIVLLIAGGVIFLLSFFIPDKSKSGTGISQGLAEDEIKKIIERELDSVRGHVDEVVDEAVGYAVEKTERSLERLSNEKIMAVSEYSDTVLAEIHKNHEEAMFLYDMLNSKHINLKNTVSEVNRTVKEAEETVTSFQKLIPETMTAAESKVPGSRISEDGIAVSKTVGGRTADSRTAEDRTRKNSTAVGGDTLGRQVSFREAAGLETVQESEPEWIIQGRLGFLKETEEQGRNDNKRILELYQQGRSTVTIARELGLGVGEVKLVIDLFQNQKKAVESRK